MGRRNPPQDDELYREPMRGSRGLRNGLILGLLIWLLVVTAIVYAVRHHAAPRHQTTPAPVQRSL